LWARMPGTAGQRLWLFFSHTTYNSISFSAFTIYLMHRTV
jgi:hypothetical protein